MTFVKFSYLLLIVALGYLAVPFTFAADDNQEAVEFEGVVIDLKDGTKANVLIEDRHFTVRFYNQEDEVVDPIYPKAIIRYEGILNKEDEENLLLRPSGDALVATRPVFPPHKYIFTMILKDDDDESRREIFTRQRLEM